MNEYVVSILIILVFFLISWFVGKKLIKLKSNWLVLLFLILYVAATDVYFEILNRGDQILRDHNIYIEFGHGSILLLAAFAICLFISVVFTITIIFTRIKNRKQLV